MTMTAYTIPLDQYQHHHEIRRINLMTPTLVSPTLVSWLEYHNHTGITPIQVTIKGTHYQAASYITKHGANWRPFIYCVGPIPACYRNSRRTVFTIAGDPCDWYVAAYYPAIRNQTQLPFETNQYAQYHPFGPNFLLAPWDSSNPIDDGEPRPRPRVTIQVKKDETEPTMTLETQR